MLIARRTTWREDSDEIKETSGKASRYVWVTCLSRNIALQNFPIRFPHSDANFRANRKFCLTQSQRFPYTLCLWSELSTMVCWDASFRAVIRGVTVKGQAAQFPGRRMTAGGAESPNNVTSTSMQSEPYQSHSIHPNWGEARCHRCPKFSPVTT